MKWLLAGFVMGMGLSFAVLQAQARPQYLIYGRSPANLNVPFRVAADGTLSIN